MLCEVKTGNNIFLYTNLSTHRCPPTDIITYFAHRHYLKVGPSTQDNSMNAVHNCRDFNGLLMTVVGLDSGHRSVARGLSRKVSAAIMRTGLSRRERREACHADAEGCGDAAGLGAVKRAAR